MRNILVAMCAALAVCMSFAPLSGSAAELSDDDAYIYYDSLRCIVDEYGLAGTQLDIETDSAYFFGRRLGGTGNPVSGLWCNGSLYICDYHEDEEVPYYSYSTGSGTISYTSARVGSSSLLFFYSANSAQVQLLGGQTTNLIGYNTIAAVTDVVDYSTAETLDDFVAAIVPQVSTEATVATAPPFTLPDEWIDGGETLAPATAEDFSIDESEAFAVLDSINLDDIESNTGLQNGFGSIWSFVSELWAVFSVGGITIVCLLIMLLSWFFGRRL